MKGCARTLLLQLAAFVALAAGIAWWLHARYALPPSRTVGVALGAGFLALLALGFLGSIRKPLRERASLAACLRGERPADGSRAVIAGPISAARETLRSPLSGTGCIAYRYEIYEIRGSGRRQHRATYFEGVAIVPSSVSTPAGDVQLLAVPAFDFAPDQIEPSRARPHWEAHVGGAAFEPESSRRTLEKEWTDDDGSYRCERRRTAESGPTLDACRFQESVVRPGERVFVVGRYEAARSGIVPDPNWARPTRIMKGDGDALLGQLRSRAIRYAVGAVLCGAAAAGVLAAYLSEAYR